MERNCTGHEDYIVPCDISAPTGRVSVSKIFLIFCLIHVLNLANLQGDSGGFFSAQIAVLTWSLFAPSLDLCTPTALSDLIHRITVATPFFGAAYFYVQWLFVIVVVLGFLWASFRQRQNDMEEEELEDDERPFIGGTTKEREDLACGGLKEIV